MSLRETVRILNLDGSLTQQRNLLGRFHPEIVPLTHLGPACRISMDDTTAEEIRRALRPELKGAITFIGSGDFHQISSLLIEQFEEPISVIVFDHHPDWDTLPPKLHCGSWVTHVLKKRPNVKKLVLLGVSSEDISSPWIQTGNLQALADDRVEIYPYWHQPTSTFLKRVPSNRSITTKQGLWSNTICWQELGKSGVVECLQRVLEGLTTKQVYVSLDKDCLGASYALTNWEEGRFSLEEVLQALDAIHAQCEIVGLDIVGDYSPPVVKGWLKDAMARFDRPREYSARGKSLSLITAINEDTNIRLAQRLLQRRASHAQLLA